MLICINKLSFCQRFLNKIKPAHHKFLIEIIYGITWKIQIMHTGSSLLVLNSALFIIPPFYLCTGRWFLEKYKFPSSGCSCSDWTSSISREITSTHTCKIRKTSSFIARFKIGSIREKSNCYNIQLYEQRKMQPENPGCILFRDACVRQRTLLASPSRNHRINTWDHYGSDNLKKKKAWRCSRISSQALIVGKKGKTFLFVKFEPKNYTI